MLHQQDHPLEHESDLEYHVLLFAIISRHHGIIERFNLFFGFKILDDIHGHLRCVEEQHGIDHRMCQNKNGDVVLTGSPI